MKGAIFAAFAAFIISLFISACGSSYNNDSNGDNDSEITDNAEREAEMEQPAQSVYECFTDKTCKKPQIAAHRGYKKTKPENSLAALRAAAELGCDFVELDTEATKDGVIVIMHDSTIDRTTTGKGKVSDYTYEQLQGFDLLGGDPNDPESMKIPTFEAMLALAKELKIMLYVDNGTDNYDELARVINKGPYLDVVLFRDPVDSCLEMRKRISNLLVMPPITSKDELDAAISAIPGLTIVELGVVGYNDELLKAVLAAGIKAQQDVFTGDMKGSVGNYTGWKEFTLGGVNLLQTQIPNLLIPAMQEYEKTGTFPDSGPGDLDKK